MLQMFHNWCFGYSLQNGVKAVGWSDTIVEILGIIFHALSVTPHVENLHCMQEDEHGQHFKHIKQSINDLDKTCMQSHRESLPYEIGMVSLSFGSILIHLVELLIIYVLYKGAQERSKSKCKIWTRLTSIFTVLDMLIFIGHMVMEKDDLLISYMVPNCIYKCYSLGVVQAFVRESGIYKDINAEPTGPISLMEYSENPEQKESPLP